MNCQQALENLDNYCDRQLTDTECREIEAHLQECSGCSSAYSNRQGMLSLLKSVPAQKPSPFLVQRILRERKNRRKQRLFWFSAGVGTALAASLAFASVILFMQPFKSDSIELPTVVATLNEPKVIQFVVHSEKPLDDVTFSVSVSPGLDIRQFSGMKHLTWNGKLIEGDNLLSLPVVARHEAPAVVVMRVNYRGEEKEYRVNLNVAKVSRQVS